MATDDDFTHYFNATARLSRENADLRARLAEVEAERDDIRTGFHRVWDQWAEAETKLAEVEAERDQWREELTASEKWRHDTALEREYFKARLAEVEAERDRLAVVADSEEFRAEDAEARLAAVLYGSQDRCEGRLHAPECDCFGPQDEEAAEVCPHDREPDNCCQGYDSDCEGPRRSAGSGRAGERVEGAIKLGANPPVRATQNSPQTPEIMVRIQRFDPQQITMDSPLGNWVTLGPAMTEAEAVEALNGYRRRDRASNRSYLYRILGLDGVVRGEQRAGDQEGQQ